ncbi:O-antigen ligase family protein [Candidatus Methylomirabilis sp.]|uniref:O-antigen ligase family protein n=1 Tax=Candidatus Methylomirabilis sp. TaxID=2032687 RepID=UPI002A66D0B3|nr:O-antigen ligase family protein [Candidatus Methylomirabilis sp.]
MIFVIVLFGQFGLSAMAYYLHVAHPAWPFWITLYAVSGVLALVHIPQHKPTILDLYFCAFIGYVTISFFMLGESSQPEFAQRIILRIIAPYLTGRMIGRHAPLSLFSGLQVLSLLYLLLIGVELVRDPDLFQSDRLYLFTADDWDRTGGDPTSFNIGTTLGTAWIAAFAYCTYKGEQYGVPVVFRARPWLFAVEVGFPVVLLWIGSRASVVSIVLSAIILPSFTSRIFTLRKVGWLVITIAALLVFYAYLPEERRWLIDDIVVATPGGSVFERLVQLSDAGRLFLESPLFGIGATNFGLRYSGQPAEFGSPHSLFAQVLVEYGLVGAGLLALLLVKIIRTFSRQMRSQDYRARPAAWGLFGIWMFVLIQAQFIGNLFYDYHVFMLTGLFISCLHNGDRWATQLNLTQARTVAIKHALKE